MRIAERREHSAEIGGNVLHDEGESHVFLLAAGVKRVEAERQEREKRHVICNKHRADKGDIHKRQHTHACILEERDDFSRQQIEKADVFERTHGCQHTEQTGKRLIVKVGCIRLVRRHENHGDKCRKKRYDHDGVFAEE